MAGFWMQFLRTNRIAPGMSCERGSRAPLWFRVQQLEGQLPYEVEKIKECFCADRRSLRKRINDVEEERG